MFKLLMLKASSGNVAIFRFLRDFTTRRYLYSFSSFEGTLKTAYVGISQTAYVQTAYVRTAYLQTAYLRTAYVEPRYLDLAINSDPLIRKNCDTMPARNR